MTQTTMRGSAAGAGIGPGALAALMITLGTGCLLVGGLFGYLLRGFVG